MTKVVLPGQNTAGQPNGYAALDGAGGLLVPAYLEAAQQATAPAAPAAGKTRLYMDSSGVLQLVPASGAGDSLATTSSATALAAAARRYVYTNSYPNLAAYTIGLADEGKMLSNGSGASTQTSVITIPTDATMVGGVPPVGFTVDVVNHANATVTITAAAGVQLVSNGAAVSGGSMVVGNKVVVRLVKVSSNYWYALPLTSADTGWVTISSLTNPVTLGPNGARYRCLNGVTTVQIDCNYNGGYAGNFAFTRLPAVACPKQPYYFQANAYGNTAGVPCWVNTNGDVAVAYAFTVSGLWINVTFLAA